MKLALVLKGVFSVFFGRSVKSDWKLGSERILRIPDRRVDVKARVVESDPPRTLAVTWTISFLIDNRCQRRLEAGNIARVGAEIVRSEARHRTDVDSRLTVERL